jgi:hypothetical protein
LEFTGNYSGSVTVYFDIYEVTVALTGTVTYNDWIRRASVPIGGAEIYYEVYHSGNTSSTPNYSGSVTSSAAAGSIGEYRIATSSGSTVRITDAVHDDHLYTDGPIDVLVYADTIRDIVMSPCFTIYLGDIGALRGEIGDIWWSTGTGTGILTSEGVKFLLGTDVYLQAVGEGNYRLSYWTGGIGGNEETYLYDKSVSMTVGAMFYNILSSTTFVLDLGIINPSEGRIMWSVGGNIPSELTSAGARFPIGTVVSVMAVGAGDYRLSYWTGSLGGNTNPERITSDARIGAVFYNFWDDTQHFSLDLNGPIHGGRIMWSVAGGIPAELTSDGAKFPVGTLVTLEAIADRRYTFMYWEDDPEGQTDPLRVLVMDQNHRVSAVFERTDDMGWAIPVLILLTGLIALALLLMARVRHNVKGAVTCDGKGLEGVIIEYAVKDRPATVTTDSNGNYRIRASAGSVITITGVVKNGYTATGKLPIQFSAENKDHADIVMEETGPREGAAVRGG